MPTIEHVDPREMNWDELYVEVVRLRAEAAERGRPLTVVPCYGSGDLGTVAPQSKLVVEVDPVKAAHDRFMEAAAAYGKLLVADEKKIKPPPPQVEPTLRHARPEIFQRGYNLTLDAGGYMKGKIPVVAVPGRPEDIRRYLRKRSVKALLVELKLVHP